MLDYNITVITLKPAYAKILIGFMIYMIIGDNTMSSILDDPKNRVKLLKAGFTGTEIERLAVRFFDSNIEVLKINWCD